MTISDEMVKAAGFRSGMAKAAYMPDDVILDDKIKRMESRGYQSERERLANRGTRRGALAGALFGGSMGLAGVGTGHGAKITAGSAAIGAGLGALIGRSAGKDEAKKRRMLMNHLAKQPKEKREDIVRSAADGVYRRQLLAAQYAY